MKPLHDISLTREDLQAAIFGFGVAKQEIEKREDRFRLMLENFSDGNGHRPEQIPKPGTGELEQAYHADGQPVYRTNKDGTVMVGKRGLPLKAQHWTAEKRSEVAARFTGKPRAGRKETTAPTSKKFKMEYWSDGSPKFLTNPDGSVKMTSKGEPWKRMRADEARKKAHLSHIARGLVHGEVA